MSENTEDPEIIAANGGRCFPAARSLADFLRFIEDGQLDADVTHDLRDLAADMENMSAAFGGAGKIKAKLTITVDITREVDGYYIIGADYAIKKPKEPRKRSIAWLTDDNAFTPNKPNQGSLFGTVRDVTPARVVR
jgi:hypothetical protein